MQRMPNDVKHFKKGIELFKNKRCDTQRQKLWKIQLCRWLTTHSISDSKKTQVLRRKKFIYYGFKKKLFGLQN